LAAGVVHAFFSTAVATASNRTAFVNAVTNLAVKYEVDGINLDWEYPNEQGIGCNCYDINDTANFLLFLQELRAHPVGKNLTITAAVGIVPWLGTEGVPVPDVSGFASVFDFITIMNYDIWGSWSSAVGPNAPLDDTCAPGYAQMGSAITAVQAWKKAGMPEEKIVLGVPAYGHSYRVSKQDAFVNGSTQLALYPPFNTTSPPAGTNWDSRPGETDVCGVKSTTPGGIIQYWGMMSLGYLDRNGDPNPGQIYKFDNCSKTPFIYDPTNEIMVSYDDPQSMRAKGQFVKAQNLRGFAMWEVGGDYHAFLIEAIRSQF
jgi:chitinase